MKKIWFLLFLACVLLSGCGAGEEEPETVGMANPWKRYDTLADAEAACGLTFPLEERLEGDFRAEMFRVMNGSLLEVRYRKDNQEVTVRMCKGEGEDISGVYETFDSVSTETIGGAEVTAKRGPSGCVYLVFKNGYSFALYAPGQQTLPDAFRFYE